MCLAAAVSQAISVSAYESIGLQGAKHSAAARVTHEDFATNNSCISGILNASIQDENGALILQHLPAPGSDSALLCLLQEDNLGTATL